MGVGDTARLLGHPGAFCADDEYGYVVEDRTPGRAVVRERSEDRAGRRYDFLYATNNLQDRSLGEAFCRPGGGYRYEVETGWYPADPSRIGDGSPGAITRRLWALSSESRNRYFHERLVGSAGSD